MDEPRHDSMISFSPDPMQKLCPVNLAIASLSELDLLVNFVVQLILVVNLLWAL